MALREFTCTRCDEKFTAPKWTCKDGLRHQVESKTYHAPTSSLRTYVSEERIELMDTGKNRMIPARLIEFVRGTYQTSDPEDQYSLDQPGSGCITPEEWRARFITKEEQVAMKEREADRKLKEANEILAKAREQVSAAAQEPEVVTSARAKARG